jgi:hypothetical protein
MTDPARLLKCTIGKEKSDNRTGIVRKDRCCFHSRAYAINTALMITVVGGV